MDIEMDIEININKDSWINIDSIEYRVSSIEYLYLFNSSTYNIM
jgi:hypothetical protein